MRKISLRLAAIEESATLAITSKAKALRAAGEPVIGFGAGEPDFPTPDHIVEAAIAACRIPAAHKYSPAAGLPDLRAEIAAVTARDSGFDVAPGRVVVTNGAKFAIFSALAAVLDPGDEVLMPAPYWVTYPEAIALSGGTMVPIATDAASGFRVTVEQLEEARTRHTKALIFVSPSNPTGAVYTPDEIAAIGRWAAAHDIWVLTDEIYQYLVYGDTPFASMPVVAPEVADHCLVVNGVSKAYAMTGWRVGWLIAPQEIATAVTRFQSHATSNVDNIAQYAALAALQGGLDPVEEMRAAFDRRRKIMQRMLSEIPGVESPEPQGAFYAFPSVEGLLGKDLAGRSAATSMDLATLLLEEIKIAVVPGEAFGAPGYLRFSFALGDDDLIEGLQRFQDLVGG
ncbi:MAG: pyridoxal phosphate-dependent aminotransferase [Acidimicrobiia bacterium]|nr:pyridoxal phosphate-dependent aminotransferase [Acidimicrobiia bacterium]